MSRAWYLLWPAGFVVGLGAESTAGSFVDLRAAGLDLATGWTVIACGLLGLRVRPGSHTGALLAACGFAWFASNFASPLNGLTIRWLPLASLMAPLTYLYRGLLVHATVSNLTGRLTSPLARVTVVAGYVASMAPGVWGSEALTVVLAGGYGIATWLVHRDAARRGERPARIAQGVSLALTAALVGGSVVRIVAPASGAADLAKFGFDVVLMSAAVGLLFGLRLRAASREAVTDLVVELGETRSGPLRDALAAVLGDPSLEIGYWISDQRGYVDTEGQPVALPEPDANRAVTSVDRDGHPVAILIHHPVVLEDARLVGALADAARLAASNAALQARVRGQMSDLDASRRRMVAAGDQERRHLEERLQEGAVRRLHEIERLLDAVRRRSNGSPAAAVRVEAAAKTLSATLRELQDLADGLRPRSLSKHGLPRALAELAERGSVPVTLTVAIARLPPEIEATGYYVCAEALANVAKYADATHVAVTASEEEHHLRVVIEDDGIGGADPDRGTGLRGLRDRVEALGGHLSVDSPSGRGTRLVAAIPITVETSPPG